MKLKWLIPSVLVLLLAIARILAPPIILGKLNAYLEKFSDTYYAHVDDFDLSLWRGAYRFEGMRIALKIDQQRPFLTASVIDVSVAWRELFRGRILSDVIATEVNLIADAAFAKTAKAQPQRSTQEAGAVGNKLFPVETERVEIRNSKIEYKELKIYADQIDGRLTNVTATEENPRSLVSLRGSFLGKAALKIVGELDYVRSPVAWVFAAELQKFNLPEGNSLLSPYLPLTFKKGNLDIYAEVKSENSRISGYVKPFLTQAEVVGDEKDFKGIKHFGVEMGVSLLNLLFRSNEKHVLATKFLYRYEKGAFKWNMIEVLSELFKNGYHQELPPGIENLLTLSSKK